MPRSEAEMCAAFAEMAERAGWSVYPETAGWDLLLVWTGRVTPPAWLPNCGVCEGDQLGIEAKMRASFEVVNQIAGRLAHPPRPRWGGILVPRAGRSFRCLVRQWLSPRVDVVFAMDSADLGRLLEPWNLGSGVPGPGCALPPIKPTGTGGEPCPRVLSPWRVSALRLCHLLRTRGYVTGADFRRGRIDRQLWRERWIRRDGKAEDGTARYVLRADPKGPLPDEGWETERDAVAEVDDAAQ